ncbi:MAG: hypothetical protein F4205_05900 [Gemmatimonadetes bacterium]|nr:hypothetical protein [Gemmatimonadota bacterium]
MGLLPLDEPLWPAVHLVPAAVDLASLPLLSVREVADAVAAEAMKRITCLTRRIENARWH